MAHRCEKKDQNISFSHFFSCPLAIHARHLVFFACTPPGSVPLVISTSRVPAKSRPHRLQTGLGCQHMKKDSGSKVSCTKKLASARTIRFFEMPPCAKRHTRHRCTFFPLPRSVDALFFSTDPLNIFFAMVDDGETRGKKVDPLFFFFSLHDVCNLRRKTQTDGNLARKREKGDRRRGKRKQDV